MRAKTGMMLAAIMGMLSMSGGHVPAYNEPKKKGQDFTDEELALVRSLPKAERKALVAELRRKYAKKV